MAKANMRSRIVSILLVLMMLLTMVPITANAAEWETVTTYEQLAAAMTADSRRNVKLGCDIDTQKENGGMGIPESLDVKAQKQLDLNGHTLRMFSAKTTVTKMIRVQSADLTVIDSSAGQTGRIFGTTDNESTYLIHVAEKGKFTLSSGRLEVDKGSPDHEYKWRRVVDCCDGGEVAINGGTIYVAPETYEQNNFAYNQEFTLRYDDFRNGHCGFALAATNECKVTISGGTFKGPVRLDAYCLKGWSKSEPRIRIYSGTFENKVMLNGAGDGSVTLTEIYGGIFLDYVQAWAAASFKSSFSTPEVVINGGQFYKKFWMRPKFIDNYNDLLSGYHVAARLNGGTFYEMFSADKKTSDYASITANGKNRWVCMSDYSVYQLANELLGGSVIQTGIGPFVAQDTGSYRQSLVYYSGNKYYTDGYVFDIKAVNNQPLRVIPNAWGVMESVTLDGDEINYAKDWNGTAVVIKNNEDHTITFKWKDLADELKTAGYRYDAYCMRYTSGDTTGLIPTDQIPTGTEYSFTIRKGADPRVYSFDLRLDLKKDSRPVNTFANQHIVRLVVCEAPPAPVAHSITIKNTHGTATPATAIAGETVTVKAKDWTGSNMMFTQWYTDTPGVTFANVNDRETTFVMPDCDVVVNPGFQYVSFTKQPIDSWPQVNHGSKATVTFSAPITKWELKEGNTTVASSGNLFINTGNPITVDIPAQSSEVEKTYTVVVTANGQKFSSNEFKVKWVSWPQAPAVEFTPADGTQFVGEIDVTVSDALYAGEEIFEIAYTTDGTDPKTSTTTIYANTDTERITLTETTTIKARTYNHDASADAEKWGPLATATYTKYSDSTLPKPTITPEGMTYTGSITAYLTAPALDGVKLEYCLMRTGDPNTIGSWAPYDPETGITVNEFGTITLYARSFKDVDAETPDGQYYVVHLTSENVSATYTRTYSAAIDNVTVGGKVGKTLTQDVVIRMNGDRFANVTAGDDVSDWFNLPAGLSAKVKELSEADGYHRTLTVTISGTPTATSAAAITVTIPKDKLYANNTADLTVLSNPNAYYSIALDADHQHDYTGQPYLYLDPGNHYQECKAGDGYNIQAHEFTAWTDNENGTHSRHCTVCKMADGSTYTETAEHTWVWVVDQEAALNQPGKQHEECTGCHAKRSENTEIPALRDYAVTVTGGTATVAAGTPITDKIEQDTVVTITADAPEAGKVFDKWVVLEGDVTLADATKATTTFTMPAGAVKLEATYKDAPPSHTHSYGTEWKYDDTNHWHECQCGDKADTAAHSFQWVIDKAATKEATGSRHEECTVCGAKRSENTVIDKLPDGGSTGNTGTGDNSTDKPGKDDSTKSPQTGDSISLIGWLAALFVSGGVLTLLGVSGKKRKESEAE